MSLKPLEGITMAQRISVKDLERLTERLNKLTENPTEYRNKETGKANIGHYTLSGAYGGYELQQIVTDGGGVTCPLYTGHVPKRELYNKMQAFISGIELGKEV